MDERRKLERFALRLPGSLQSMALNQDGLSGEEFGVVTRDISSNGAFFTTDIPLELGTKVGIELMLELENPDAEMRKRAKINVHGTVLRIDPGGMAIRFDKKYRVTPF